MPSRTILPLLLFPLALAISCGPTVKPLPPDPDARRDTALPLPLDIVTDDGCDPRKGDALDWRYVVLDQPSLLTVEISFDNATTTANVYLHNAFGQKIDERTASSASPAVTFEDIEVGAERYYVRVECMTGASLYSLKASRADIPPPEPTTEELAAAQAEAEAYQEAKEERERRERRKRRKKRDRDDDDKDDKNTSSNDSDSTADADTPSKPPVIGEIVLITPGDRGYVSIRISGAGKKYGVDASMTGTLKDNGVKVELSDCSRSSCNGIIKMDPVELDQTSKKVIFSFD